MSFFSTLLEVSKAAMQPVQQAQQQQPVWGSRAPGKQPECTPCAASAYVEGLRGDGQPKKRRKKKR